MPNFELHGWIHREANKVSQRIKELFESSAFADDIVVTFFPTIVRDFKGRERPFIRVVNSMTDLNKEIIAKLKTLKVDIEVSELKDFIEAV